MFNNAQMQRSNNTHPFSIGILQLISTSRLSGMGFLDTQSIQLLGPVSLQIESLLWSAVPYRHEQMLIIVTTTSSRPAERVPGFM